MPKVIVNLKDHLVGLNELPTPKTLGPNEWWAVDTQLAEHPQVKLYQEKKLIDILTPSAAAKLKAEMEVEAAKEKAETAAKASYEADKVADARHKEAQDAFDNLRKFEKPAEKPKAVKAEKKPAEEKPAEKPEEKPAEKPEEKPAEKPEEKPAEPKADEKSSSKKGSSKKRGRK